MLYFVGTPIGNLEDFSFRAINTLKQVDEIGCEDTRHSVTLLNRYEIKKPLFSYHKFNEKEESEKIIEKLKAGKNIAIITDAGMPTISDPGNVLTKRLLEERLEYTVIGGVCAFVSALVLSGLPADKFCFLGFLPDKTGERENMLSEYKTFNGTLIFYSAPHDLKRNIESMYKILGERKAVAVKEISKIHETVTVFNLKDGIDGEQKGEFVLLVEGAKKGEENKDLTDEQLINKYIESGLDKKDALKKVAKERNIAKSNLYKYTVGK